MFFKCKHPANRLAVEKGETNKVIMTEFMQHIKAVKQERMTNVQADIYKAKADKVPMKEREAALKELWGMVK